MYSPSLTPSFPLSLILSFSRSADASTQVTWAVAQPSSCAGTGHGPRVHPCPARAHRSWRGTDGLSTDGVTAFV